MAIRAKRDIRGLCLVRTERASLTSSRIHRVHDPAVIRYRYPFSARLPGQVSYMICENARRQYRTSLRLADTYRKAIFRFGYNCEPLAIRRNIETDYVSARFNSPGL